jgi:hypothetical protein
MRIYLDTNILQYLKNNSNLLQLVKEDKCHNIYCYSEAHVLDLLRDKTNQKESDLKFMSEIVEDNFWSYDKQILFNYITPIEYYNSLDKDYVFSLQEQFNNEPLLKPFKSLYESTPLNFSDIIKANTLPDDFPENLKKVLCEPINMYDFIISFYNFSSELTSEQKKFKELLTYLRNNKLTNDIYKYFGIEGFENGKLIDKEKFKESIVNYCLKDKKEKYRYDLFLSIYNTLEIFGFVPGKPRKQALPNMIDDGRHAFYGLFCDIIVSVDADFINKTRFIYDVFDQKISIFNINEFISWLEISQKQNTLNLTNLIEEVNKDYSIIPELYKAQNDENTCVFYKLPQIYFTYFDLIGFVYSDKFEYYFFTKEINNQSQGTFIKEIQYVTNRLIKELGSDIYGNGDYAIGEIIDEKWKGRTWLLNNVQISLTLQKKICLSVSVNEITK